MRRILVVVLCVVGVYISCVRAETDPTHVMWTRP